MANQTVSPQISSAIEGKAKTNRPYTIEKDDAFHLIQNARRRAVLRYLLEQDLEENERFRMRDVAEEVAAWEHDTTVVQLTSTERQRVYIALYQSHLPKLDEHGVIEYDQDRGYVEPTPLITVFESYLEDGLHADRNHLLLEGDRPEDATGITRTVRTLLKSA